jgi:Uncharacterized conserved protein
MLGCLNNWRKNCRAKTLWGISCLLFGLIAVGLYLSVRLCLIIETDQGMRLVIPVQKGDTFSLKYTHSVQKTPVSENFVIVAADELILDSTVYQTYGVGLPFLPSEGHFEQQGDKFVLTGLERRFDKISVHAGPIAKLVLETGNQVVPLYAFHEGGALVTIRTKPYYYRWIPLD